MVWKHDIIHIHETGSTYNISKRRQRRTEPRPQATCTKNLVKFGRVLFELFERTDKQSYSSQHFEPSLGRSDENSNPTSLIISEELIRSTVLTWCSVVLAISWTECSQNIGNFTARRYAIAVYAVVVCLCVCPSHAGIVSKRLNIESRKLCHGT